MNYLVNLENQINELKNRYAYFQMIQFNQEIIDIVSDLELDDNVKSAIVVIDTSMRMQNVINDSNKDRLVLSTDILSALFYRYLSQPFLQDDFKVLTRCVTRINELKEIRSTVTEQQKLTEIDQEIHYMFVQPYMNDEKVVAYE
ncbi:hexaprenyl-diphosphate synthase small subunit [Macrococcoides canis]|uniref:Hexaprenyl-diphosphate synthase small subunit ((2E,6E)-farnesyl-diphosphate specific) n=1 Tax=Macrococcoides canis TaxID=1855823 RepID=A0A1W7ABG2_9STAP|nr:hexaprenyl-diphosphate synthase small subunit [Macrococcus canis]ARQ06953.1 Hexaprenyl-diphosphate synthase small subunit ((2E,6E)-farnesyl-diphosphate specific) [Macrococcus canis]UJS26865.1 hypothetical protein L2Z53_06630 [Macrococcus canis]UTG99114.1 hypothetical protein KFV04_06240 [Macrococcus canis]WBF51727.1 hypothetical protein LL975_06325 [Macrococcus canis]